MDAETAKALEDSIAHWKRMKEDPECRESPYGHDCRLCQMFHFNGCGPCPVKKRTGRNHCQGTPWRQAYNIWDDYHDEFILEILPKWQKAADAEIAFLEGLREE